MRKLASIFAIVVLLFLLANRPAAVVNVDYTSDDAAAFSNQGSISHNTNAHSLDEGYLK